MTLTAVDAEARENGGDTGRFEIVRTGDMTGPLTVYFTSAGSTAIPDVDYKPLQASPVVIPAGSGKIAIEVIPIDDDAKDGHKTVTLELLADAAYTLGGQFKDTVTIKDDETDLLSVVTLVVNATSVVENAQQSFSVMAQRTGGDTTKSLQVAFAFSGTATAGVDYGPAPGTVTIPPNATSMPMTIPVLNDDEQEGDETLVVELQPSPDHVVGAVASVALLIEDDDLPLPLAHLDIDQMVEAGEVAMVNVTLSEAPLDISPVTITLGTRGTAAPGVDYAALASKQITIATGTAGALQVQTLPSADGLDKILAFDMIGVTNARKGNQTSHVIMIVNQNIAPRVEWEVLQEGRKTRYLTPVGGAVTVKAVVKDVNSADTHAFDWSGSDTNLLGIQSGGGAPEEFIFNPATLLAGSYTVRVKVTENRADSPLSTEVEIHLTMLNAAPVLENFDSDGDNVNDQSEGYGDGDQDGVPDYLDYSLLPIHELQEVSRKADGFIIATQPRLALRLGDVAAILARPSARVLPEEIAAYDSPGGIPDATKKDTDPNVGGYFDFEITGLTIPGMSVKVVIPQLEPIPGQARYRKYTRAGGWKTFTGDGRNQLYSAPGKPGECPPPGSPSYVPGLIKGHHCVQMLIQDGGPNDADGVTNYVIKDPGGVATAPEPAEKPIDPAACGGLFCTQGGGGAAGIPLALLLAFAAGRQRRRRGPH